MEKLRHNRPSATVNVWQSWDVNQAAWLQSPSSQLPYSVVFLNSSEGGTVMFSILWMKKLRLGEAK